MTPEQIGLVKSSYARLANDSRETGHRFYRRLLETHPYLRKLFRQGAEEQGEALMGMLGTVVGCLDVQERIVPLVYELGRRHSLYGVRDADFDPFGKALLDTLAESLGPEFTPPVRDAWQAAYGFMAEIMQDAARRSVD
jgi:hemoglobin-like flavoprotein